MSTFPGRASKAASSVSPSGAMTSGLGMPEAYSLRMPSRFSTFRIASRFWGVGSTQGDPVQRSLSSGIGRLVMTDPLYFSSPLRLAGQGIRDTTCISAHQMKSDEPSALSEPQQTIREAEASHEALSLRLFVAC